MKKRDSKQKSKKTKYYHVSEKAFCYSLILCIGMPTREGIKNVLNKNDIIFTERDLDRTYENLVSNYDPYNAAVTFRMNPGVSFIVMYKWKGGDSRDYGNLVHELFHVVDLTLRQRGIKLSDDSDEVYAYHMSYFMENLCYELF